MTKTQSHSPGEGASFAVTRVGEYTVGIELSQVAAFIDSAGGDGDVALEALLDLDSVPGAPKKLLRLAGDSRPVLLEVRSSIQMGHRLAGRCQRPALVAASLDRFYMRGVLRDGDRLVYVLDVDRIARSFAQTTNDGE